MRGVKQDRENDCKECEMASKKLLHHGVIKGMTLFYTKYQNPKRKRQSAWNMYLLCPPIHEIVGRKKDEKTVLLMHTKGESELREKKCN